MIVLGSEAGGHHLAGTTRCRGKPGEFRTEQVGSGIPIARALALVRTSGREDAFMQGDSQTTRPIVRPKRICGLSTFEGCGLSASALRAQCLPAFVALC